MYLTNELSYADSVKQSYLAVSGYRKDEQHDFNTDAGFLARCALFADGRKAQFMSRLDFDLGNQELYMLNNIDALFSIYRAKDAFLLQNLIAASVTQHLLVLHSAKLYAKMIDVQPC